MFYILLWPTGEGQYTQLARYGEGGLDEVMEDTQKSTTHLSHHVDKAIIALRGGRGNGMVQGDLALYWGEEPFSAQGLRSAWGSLPRATCQPWVSPDAKVGGAVSVFLFSGLVSTPTALPLHPLDKQKALI